MSKDDVKLKKFRLLIFILTDTPHVLALINNLCYQLFKFNSGIKSSEILNSTFAVFKIF